jgi:hypothetical protein
MKLNLCPSFPAPPQPRGLHGGYYREIASHDHGGSSPMTSLVNPALVPVVTYEYLICLPPGERLWPLTRQQARRLLSGSCTLDIEGHRLRPNKSGYSPVLSSSKNGWGTKCVLPGLTPWRDLYQSLFYLSSHTPGTLGSIIREPPILGK